ncbi:MAG: mechanosensitive ion channel domain-containing protein [bacterium]
MEKFLIFDKTIISDLILSLLIISILWLIRRIFIKYIVQKFDTVDLRYKWQKASYYIVVLIGLIIIVPLWFGALSSLGTFLGIITAGVAIALKDLLVNFVGWFFILIRKPFQVGDRIQIGDLKGDVIDLRLFQFSVMEVGGWVYAEQSTGRIVHIPNGIVFIQPQANYTIGFKYIWDEIPILVTFESDWKKAKNILQQVLERNALHMSDDAENQIKEAAKTYMIYYNKLTPIVYTSIKDSGVELTMRFLCNPRSRRNTEEEIFEDVLQEFAKCSDIDFAYPTQRFYNNQNEGKPGKS